MLAEHGHQWSEVFYIQPEIIINIRIWYTVFHESIVIIFYLDKIIILAGSLYSKLMNTI